MTKALFFIPLLTLYLTGNAQTPSTKEGIGKFIDSIGRSNDRQVITSSIFPAFADGTNFKWRQHIWRNKNKELLWVETILPDSISTVFFYCKDTLVFVSEMTYSFDAATNKRNELIRDIFFYQSEIIDDSAPGRNNNNAKYYIEESRKYLEHAKLAD